MNHQENPNSNSNSGLLRFRSAPSSLFSNYTIKSDLIENRGLTHFDSHDFIEEFEEQKPNLNGFSSISHLPPQYPKQSTCSLMGSNLMRQSSSPAGLFSHITPQNGYGALRGVGNYRLGHGNNNNNSDISPSSSRLRSSLSFSSGFPSLGTLPQISETGDENIDGNSNENPKLGNRYTFGSWGDSSNFPDNFSVFRKDLENDGKIFSSSQDMDFGIRANFLSHHLSLPKTSAEIVAMDKFLHFQDSVPCKVRAKRGCATHPRSIAERVRRTRISERMRKLQELVPNMDKMSDEDEVPPMEKLRVGGEDAQPGVGIPIHAQRGAEVSDLTSKAERARKEKADRKAELLRKRKCVSEAQVPIKRVRIEPSPEVITLDDSTPVPEGVRESVVASVEGQGETGEATSSRGSLSTAAGTSSSSGVPFHARVLPPSEVVSKFGVDGIFADSNKAGLLAVSALQFPADAARMPQTFNGMVALAQSAVPQGYMAFNSAVSFMMRVNKDLEAKVKSFAPTLERQEKEMKGLEARLKGEENQALAAETARVELAKSVQAKVDAEREIAAGIQAKLTEAEAEITSLKAQLQEAKVGAEVAVGEAVAKTKAEVSATFENKVNTFFRDGWVEAAQTCQAPTDHEVWDKEAFLVSLPYPNASIPQFQPPASDANVDEAAQ